MDKQSGNRINYEFFEKPTKIPKILLAESAINSRSKRTILTQECLRRFRNTKIELDESVRNEHLNKLGLSCAKLRLNWASLTISIFSKYLSQIQLSFKFLIKINIVLTFEIYEAKLPDFQPLKVIFHSGCLPWRSTSIFSKFRFKKRSYLIRH